MGRADALRRGRLRADVFGWLADKYLDKADAFGPTGYFSPTLILFIKHYDDFVLAGLRHMEVISLLHVHIKSSYCQQHRYEQIHVCSFRLRPQLGTT